MKAILDVNQQARLDGLRAALVVLAPIALLALVRVVVQRGEDTLVRSFRNLERTHVVETGELEVADLVWARSLIVSKAALALLEGGDAE